MSRRAHRSALITALVTALIGLFALGTWQFGAWPLATFGAQYVPMAPITALLFLLLATAQGAWLAWPRHRLVRGWVAVASGLAAIAAALALAQAWLGLPLPWESWFNPAAGRVGAIPLGRMAPLTAVSFLLSSAAQVLLVFGRGAWRLGTLPAAGFVLVAGCLVAAGYAAGTPISYSGETVPMALLTALGFVALSLSLLVAGPLVEMVRHWLHLDATIPAGTKPGSWGNRLLVAVTLIVSVLILLIGFFNVRSEQTAARETVRRELRSVADLKATQIDQWRQERLSEGRFLHRTTAVAEDIAAFLAQPDGAGNRARVLGWLEPIKAGDRYEEILLFDPAGGLRLHLASGPGKSAAGWQHELRLIAAAGGGPVLTDLHVSGVNGRVHLNMVVPVYHPSPAGGARELLAVLVLVMDPAQVLFPLLRSWPVPSETAEVFLVRREGDEVVYLTELRNLKAPPLSVRRSVHEPLLPAAMAARGETGVHAGRGYRGRPVLTVANRIAQSPWWLIANIDQAEVYAPIRKEARRSGLMVLSLMLVVGLAAALVWRQRHAVFLQHSLALEHERVALSERLATVMRYANDIILLLDEHGRIVEANERALAAYGYTLAELQALPVGGLRPAAAAGALPGQLDGLLQAQGAHFETVHRRRDGSEFPVEVSGRAVEIAGRRYGLGIYRDISERRAAEAALRASEEKFRAYVEQAADALFVHDLTGRILDVNRQACASLGFSREELLRMNVFDLEQVVDAGAARAAWAAITPDAVRTFRGRHRRRDGTTFPVEVRVGCFDLRQERLLLALVRDTSEREAFERQIERFNHLYAALSQVNQAIVHARERGELLQEICRVIVEYGHFRMAWIGWVEDGTRRIRPAARHGDDQDYVGRLRIAADDVPEGQGPTGTAVRENRTVVCADIANDARTAQWQEPALRSGLRSSIALPIRAGGVPVGVLNVYASEAEFFGREEIALLEEAAMDVAFGLETLARDEQRRQADLALRSSEERFRAIFKHAPVGISLTMADDGSIVVNDEHVRITGVSEVDSQKPGIFNQITHPEDLKRQMAMAKLFARGEIGHYTVEKRYLRPDGTVQWAELTSRFYTDPATNRRVILTILIDIAARKAAEIQLQAQLDELRRWHQATLGREDRILELKVEVNGLLARLGQAPRYTSVIPSADQDKPHA
ncbi:MAG: PAS domain S-box protein [Opitutaceae bacterium]|nr:PAS domain S-box protein [Opitutaceae bacterium]